VPYLYSGRVRPRHLMLVMLAGLVALAAAIAVTPVGQEWADSLIAALADLSDSLTGFFQGLFS
jgi:SteA-like C-terminal domain